MTICKGILIDPFAKTVEPIDLAEADNPEAIAKILHCEYIQAIRVHVREVLWIDECGVLGDLDRQEFITLPTYPTPIAGRALLLGVSYAGGSESTRINIDMVRAAISFPHNVAARIAFAQSLAQTQLDAELRTAAGENVIYGGPDPKSVLPSGFSLVRAGSLAPQPGAMQ